MVDISFEQIKKLLSIEDLFEPVKQAFIAYNSPDLIGIPVNLLHFPNDGDTHIKIAAIAGYDYFSIKVASMFPGNSAQNLSPFSGAIFLFDGKTGYPAAILNDKGLITDLRTAAAGALITDYAAAKTAKTVAIIGTGIQAYHQVTALAKLRQISQLVIYGRNANNALLLKDKLTASNPTLPITTAATAEKAVKMSEIIITTTSSKTPLVKGEWLIKGQHVTAIGADDTFKNELDSRCFESADTLFIDSLELNYKYGEFAHAIKLSPDLIHKTIEFGKAFQDDSFANHSDRITVAKLVGIGVQDLAGAMVVLNKVKDRVQ